MYRSDIGPIHSVQLSTLVFHARFVIPFRTDILSLSWYERGDASFPHEETKHRLVLPPEDEAAPHPRTGRRGVASSPGRKMRSRLVASFSCGETRRCLSPARGDVDVDDTAGSGRSTYRYPVGLVRTARTGRYRSKRRTLVPCVNTLDTTRYKNMVFSSSATFGKDVEGRRHLGPSVKNAAKKKPSRRLVKNMVFSSSATFGEDVEGRRHLRPSAKNAVKKKPSRRLVVTSWIRIVKGGQRRIKKRQGSPDSPSSSSVFSFFFLLPQRFFFPRRSQADTAQ
ncbi:hypothetical protein GW17_00020655 [Ensete ventricosum]|nr:hypothetical protein GW17_00020655 [Ensete ventricosum]